MEVTKRVMANLTNKFGSIQGRLFHFLNILFMAKGMYGWVNILMSLFFCYIHYFAGIIYALVITYNSKYADLYEKKQADDIKRIKLQLKENSDNQIDIDNNKGELIVMGMFLSIFIGLFVLVIYFK